jgi:hypothetical protein
VERQPAPLRPGWRDRLTPAAVLLVSRAWVLREVAAQPELDDAQRAALADELIAYEPPRQHGLRNNFVAWSIFLGGTGLAHLAGVPPWTGFVAGLVSVLLLARALTVRSLRWRLAQLCAASAGPELQRRPESSTATPTTPSD